MEKPTPSINPVQHNSEDDVTRGQHITSPPRFTSAWAHNNNEAIPSDVKNVQQRENNRTSFHRSETEPMNNRNAPQRRGHQHKHRRRGPGDCSDKNPSVSLQSPSLPDQLASLTMDFLKWTGGVTLQTTGLLVSPPLHMTRTLLLPALLDASIEAISQNTPIRIKDWFRIVSTSIYHFFTVLNNTPRGKHFRGRLRILWMDIVDLLTADATRQAFLDGTATLVKFAKLLSTPEAHEWMQQVGIWNCRLLQVLSQGQNQRLVHDWVAALQSVTLVLADPHTTLALAEVTAYLCYALEMEQQQQQQQQQQHNDGEVRTKSRTATTTNRKDNVAASIASSTSPKMEIKGQRRKERNDYIRQTYMKRTTLQDPYATVEQAILDSLGIFPHGTNEPTIPDRVVLNSPPTTWNNTNTPRVGRNNATSLDDASKDDDSSLRSQQHSQHHHHSIPDWTQRALHDVNVDYLREHIERAADIHEPLGVSSHESGMGSTTSTIPGDIEDIANLLQQGNPDTSSQRREPVVVSWEDASPSDNDNPVPLDGSSLSNTMPLEGETSVQHFYRLLDSILERKRDRAVHMFRQRPPSTPRKGRVRKFTPGSLRGSSTFLHTIKQRLAEQSDVCDPPVQLPIDASATKWMKKNSRCVYIGLVLALSLVCSWFLLGCYGIYVLLRRPSQTLTTHKPVSREFVFRIVHEVVHQEVNADTKRGKVYIEHESLHGVHIQQALDHIANMIFNASTVNV